MGLPPRLVAGLVLVSLALLAVPVALVPVPPVLDYPNHMARLCLIAGDAAIPPLDSFYMIDWAAASTNVGMDLVAALVGGTFGCETLSRLLLATAILLPPLGAAVLYAVLHRGWHWWQLAFALMAWSSTAVAGFLNFQIALGLALFAAAVDAAVSVRSVPLRFGLRALLGLPVMVCHAFGGVFLGVLLAGLDVGAAPIAWRDRAALTRRLTRGGLAALAGFGVPMLLLMLLAPVPPGAASLPPGSYGLKEKLLVLVAPFLTYDASVDFLFLTGLLLVVWLVIRFGRVRTHAGLVLAAAGCAVLSLAVPRDILDASFVDWRFAIMAPIALGLALRPDFEGRPAALAAAAALALMAVARTGWILSVWQSRSADVAAVERVIAQVPLGAALLPARMRDSGGAPVGRHVIVNLETDLHYPVLAIPRRRAFVPTLFAMPGQHPVRVRPDWAAHAGMVDQPVPAEVLPALVGSDRAAAGRSSSFRYAQDWPSHFDYLLLLNADGAGPLDPAVARFLDPVADEGFARLYRVRR